MIPSWIHHDTWTEEECRRFDRLFEDGVKTGKCEITAAIDAEMVILILRLVQENK